jgi:hypothetical protein
MESKSTMYSDGLHLHFSSVDRVGGTSDTDFIMTHKIPPPAKGMEYNRVAVVDMAIPKSWYLVSAPYNTFILTELGVQSTITVPPGNYTVLQWCTQIPLLMTAASTTMGHNWVYAAARVLIPDNGLIRYTVTGNGGNQPSITVMNIGETDFDGDGNMSQQLGLFAGTTSFSSNALTGSIVYNATGEFGVRLISDICEAEGSDTLADVLDVGLSAPGSVIRFQAQHPILQSKRFQLKGTNSFRYQLVSATTGRPINTNGLPLIVHLKIWRQEEGEISMLRQILTSLKSIEDLLRNPPSIQTKEAPSEVTPIEEIPSEEKQTPPEEPSVPEPPSEEKEPVPEKSSDVYENGVRKGEPLPREEHDPRAGEGRDSSDDDWDSL